LFPENVTPSSGSNPVVESGLIFLQLNYARIKPTKGLEGTALVGL